MKRRPFLKSLTALGGTLSLGSFDKLSAEEYRGIEYGSQLDTISKIFRIAFFTTQIWGVEFIDPGFEYKARNGQLLQSETEITDIEVIKLYYY